MAVKLIKKHQDGTSGIRPLVSSWEQSLEWLQQTNNQLGSSNSGKYDPKTFNNNFLKAIAQPSISISAVPGQPTILKQSTPSGQMSGINIKPIGQALAEDAARIKKLKDATEAANKAANAAKFANGINIASSLTDPALALGEGIATSMGAKFAEKDAVSGAIDAIDSVGSSIGSMFGPAGTAIVKGVGMGLKVLDFADRAAGKEVKSFSGNTGSLAYTDFSTQGKQYRWTQRKKAGRAEAEKKVQQGFYGNAMQVKKQQDQLKAGAVDLAQQNQISNINTLGGIDNHKSLLAKKGTKLTLKNIKAKANYNHKRKHVPLDGNTGEIISGDVTSFADGGKFNLIPEGELHARLNHYDKSIAKYVTGKGIAVVTEEAGGTLTQHAEIERNEITFHLEVSKELEALHKRYNDGDKDAALEAGKLLVFEILENTVDNTGLIETVA